MEETVPELNANASGVQLQDDETSGRGREGASGAATGRRGWLPRLVAGLAAAAIVPAGWIFFELYSAADGGQLTSAETPQPVTQYSVDVRGESVELAGNTLTDTRLDLADLRGQVVVVNVWGSWCNPCREEAPVLARLSREYADRGVQFVGLNVKDSRAAAIAFEEEFGITYPSIEDRDGEALLALVRHVPAQAVPVTLVLDRDGRVAARVIGVTREQTLRALLDGTLAEDRS